MTGVLQALPPSGLSPALAPRDPWAEHWVRQFTVRLRREVTWLRFQRGPLQGGEAERLPPQADPAQESLDLLRYRDEKRRFLQLDPTAAYLTRILEAEEPAPTAGRARGGFGWVVGELDLDAVACFTLGAALAGALDGAVGAVVAACLSDAHRTRPDLELVQRLWDEPEEVVRLADPGHSLFRYRLIVAPRGEDLRVADWRTPLALAPLVCAQLADPTGFDPAGLVAVERTEPNDMASSDSVGLAAARLNAGGRSGARIMPVVGGDTRMREDAVAAVAGRAGRTVLRPTDGGPPEGDPWHLDVAATLCWLRGSDLFLPAPVEWKPPSALPLTLFLGLRGRSQATDSGAAQRLPVLEVAGLAYAERLVAWARALGDRADGLDDALTEVARRFRFERGEIEEVAAPLRVLTRPLDGPTLLTACRSAQAADLGDVAEKVEPRFREEALILPARQDRQFRELLRSMRALTRVHHGWGTGAAWGESGITALFAGPPGTGKTMAAEVLAGELDLPMYRVDLSQVMDKYIGETEKRLKRLFDASEGGDVLLFFDEADALFGKRSDVKDAHDRYANIQVSYLLQRMERFEGTAILATNRKGDLDEAFLRRLRFIIDFPAPGARARERMWRQMVPRAVDVAGLDFRFLADRFPLAGGHIRSIVLYACLQCAADDREGGRDERRLTMDAVLRAVKREYDKLGRPVSLQAFDPYTALIREMEASDETG